MNEDLLTKARRDAETIRHQTSGWGDVIDADDAAALADDVVSLVEALERARRPLLTLRESLARIAQMAGLGHEIPGLGHEGQGADFSAIARAASENERGWNQLAAMLVEQFEKAHTAFDAIGEAPRVRADATILPLSERASYVHGFKVDGVERPENRWKLPVFDAMEKRLKVEGPVPFLINFDDVPHAQVESDVRVLVDVLNRLMPASLPQISVPTDEA